MTNDRRNSGWQEDTLIAWCFFDSFLVGLKYFLNITYVRKYLYVVKLRFIHVFFLNFSSESVFTEKCRYNWHQLRA